MIFISWTEGRNGSAPRVRGTVVERLPERLDVLFIPACAGNSRSGYRDGKHPAVHPRVCGEQLVIGYFATVFAGSSPRVRGTELLSSPAAATARFIPACAGNSGRHAPQHPYGAVHPREIGRAHV